MTRIYLDYAATTPLDPLVLESMLPYFSEKFGNPMSLHSFGEVTRKAVEKSRRQVADFLHCNPIGCQIIAEKIAWEGFGKHLSKWEFGTMRLVDLERFKVEL